MKILHTGDWHIGKLVHGYHMTEDQDYALNSLCDVIKEEKPDVLVIAGDIYDRSNPPVEAVALLNKYLNKILMELETPIIAIAGNHDSADRLHFGSDIFSKNGLYIEGVFRKDIKRIVLKDEHGPVNFYLLPFVEPAIVREVFNADVRNYEDAAKIILDYIKENMNKEERNVLVAHGYVTGINEPETCESERALSIGGTDYIKAEIFEEFHYTALGHLHKCQKVSDDRIRYSGSLLKYSFSECNHKKSVTVVTLDEKGKVEINLKPVRNLRDMRKIKGNLENLLDMEVYKDTNVEDYIHAILTDEGELLEPMRKLKSIYPNIMSLERENRINNLGDIKTSAGEGAKYKSKMELFEEFYVSITGKEFTEEKKEIMSSIIEELQKEERSN